MIDAVVAGITTSGEGDWGVLSDKHMSLFPSREQAMAFAGWLIGLGKSPSIWSCA